MFLTRRLIILLPILTGAAAPALAQTVIGGGACTSSSLMGSYEFSLNGRQVAANGVVSKLFSGVGTAVFDGLSSVKLTLTANSVNGSQSFGTPLAYAGTYSLQSNCLGSITINSGDAATFTLETYNQGKAFAIIGSDANYAYNGSGNVQPATCPTTLSGGHEFSATGNTLSGASLTGVLDLAGLLTFDGQGNLTAAWTQSSNLISSTITATGTYSVTSSCLASAALTDSASNKYAISFSIYSTAPDFVFTVASPSLLFNGSGSSAQPATGTGCSPAMLKGTYEMALSGRVAPGGIVTKYLASDGSATFDGAGKVTFNLTASSVTATQSLATPLVYSGTYTLPSSCVGAVNITSGDTATFSLVAYAIDTTTQQAKSYTLVGVDATYAYNGGGTVQPDICATATLSGAFPFSGTGNSFTGTTDTGVVDIAGILQFDGQGNATATWTQASNTATVNVSATGTYSVTAACLGAMTLTDTASNKYAGAISVFGAAAGNFELVAANPQLIFLSAGRAAFVNPGQAVVNAASFVAAETPAGSVFSLFGSNLATKQAQPTSVPLPTTLLTTTVTVNGELAPLFYVDPGQINAQMPEDIKAGVATVIVKNGTATSNAVAVEIPATGTPGIVVYGNNRAVVVNQNGSVNSPSATAKVGDTLVAYFTGGGPVNAAGTLVTGAVTPNGLSPVSGPNSITLGGTTATVSYMGLTPGSIGLYQANFIVPKVSTGDHPLVITISGQASNNPLVAIQ
jgi:uncharacterized protein (TIGR03437 family)